MEIWSSVAFTSPAGSAGGASCRPRVGVPGGRRGVSFRRLASTGEDGGPPIADEATTQSTDVGAEGDEVLAELMKVRRNALSACKDGLRIVDLTEFRIRESIGSTNQSIRAWTLRRQRKSALTLKRTKRPR